MSETHDSGNPHASVPAALSLPEAALELGISPGTMRRRVEDGTVRVFRVGPSLRVPVAEIARIRGEEQVPA